MEAFDFEHLIIGIAVFDFVIIGIGIAVAVGWLIRELRFDTLRKREKTLAAIVEAAPDAIVLTDRSNRIEMVNPRTLELFEYEEHDLVGEPVEILVPEALRAKHVEYHEVFFDSPYSRRMGNSNSINARARDGRSIPVDICLSQIEIEGERHAISIVRDVTEQRKLAETVERMAFRDSLTGVPNRRLFEKRLEAVLDSAADTGHMVAVLYLDVDGFKGVNDTHGHAMGDQLLVSVANRLSVNLRAEDEIARGAKEDVKGLSVSRLGGDEFTILLGRIGEVEDAARVARRVIEAFAEPVELDAAQVSISMSIGIAVAPMDGADSEALLRSADAAMYEAKRAGRGRYVFYDSKLNEAAVRRQDIRRSLHSALDTGRLEVHYQLLRGCSTSETCSAEALVRWMDSDLGQVSPADFVPVAEESGLIGRLGLYVLDSVFAQIRHWRDEGWEVPAIAVNVSPIQLRDPEFAATVVATAAGYDLGPDAIEIEITESVVMAGDAAVQENLERLSSAGVQLILDDFGTGFSSLSHLTQLPIDRVKLDRSFVSSLCDRKDMRELINGLISIAHCLEMRVTAEGVENEREVDFLKEMGCDTLQGFLFSPAVDAAGFERFMRRAKDE